MAEGVELVRLLAAVLPPSLRVIPGVEGGAGEGAAAGAAAGVEGPPIRILVAELPSDAPVNLIRLTLRSGSGAAVDGSGCGTAGRDPGRGRESNGGRGGDLSCQTCFMYCCRVYRHLSVSSCLFRWIRL